MQRQIAIVWWFWCSLLGLGYSAWVADGEEISICRDPWGIPHVFAETDSGAFYGLGYATAEDRSWQMTYHLRIIQGRLAEVIGNVPKVAHRMTAVEHDRRMRTMGFYRAAVQAAERLDPTTRELLQAYCDGVNAALVDHPPTAHPLFAGTGLTAEAWTIPDCLATWWYFGQFFATDGTRDLMALRTGQRPPVDLPENQRGLESAPPLIRLPPDDAAAVVQRSDLSLEWIARVQAYAAEMGLTPSTSGDQEPPKFSHAWVIGGKRSTTGAAVLVSDPQTPVRNPSLLYEFHIQGASFNARGVGVAGNPLLLIGFTPHVAWGVTALGADQADLWMLRTDLHHPGQYELDGQWRPFSIRREEIKVKGQPSEEVLIQESHWGPIVTEFSFANPDDPPVALKRIPLHDSEPDTVRIALSLMQARSVQEFDTALQGWRFPSANLVFGDSGGGIGYRVVGALPVRAKTDRSQGRVAQLGLVSTADWQGTLPPELAPGVLNPASGFLFSGNHRPIESWYPLPMGLLTGGGGDTVRSWRLRELLSTRPQFTPAEILAMHYDSVNPARRDLVRLALHLRDVQQEKFPPAARRALEILEPWYRGGAMLNTEQPGWELAIELPSLFRITTTPLVEVYGGGESGLAYFLKTLVARTQQDPNCEFTVLEKQYIRRALVDAWNAAADKYGEDPGDWNQLARNSWGQRGLGLGETLDGFPAFDRRWEVTVPPLIRVDGGTLGGQPNQSYTQWVPLHDPDQAQTLLPIGQSERPDHPHRLSTLELWERGQLHPAPLSRDRVKELGVTTRVIQRPSPAAIDRVPGNRP